MFGLALLAFSAVTGIYGAYSSYQAGQAQADSLEAQAKTNAELARRQAEEEAKAESQEVREMREQQRRRRATIEAAYATSGVLLEGSASDILVRQREADEYNVQARHQEGGIRRRNMLWQGEMGLATGMNQARAARRAGTASLISGLGNTATNTYTGFKTWSS